MLSHDYEIIKREIEYIFIYIYIFEGVICCLFCLRALIYCVKSFLLKKRIWE